MLNKELLEKAQQAYDGGDYAAALKDFYTLIKEHRDAFEPGETGHVYHMLGNCLMKMRSFADAAIAYEKSLTDSAYASRAAVRSNYGLTLSSLGENERAIEQFEQVLKDPTYATPYKAYNGLGSVYMKMGDYAAAGTAFRNAAVDVDNPTPVKSLLNLGVCFMGLGRPNDALDTYNAIFEFDPDAEILHKTYANIGQAYVADGRMAEAVEAFDRAMADGKYELSDAAMADYFRAKSATAIRDDSGIDALDSFSVSPSSYAASAVEPFVEDETLGAGIPSADDTGFFELPDDENDFEKMMHLRSKRSRRGLKIGLTIVIILVLLVAAAGILYWQGYGWPTQEQTISSLFEKNANGEDVSDCWITPSSDEDTLRINRIMNSVAQTSDVTIDYLERGTLESVAVVTATTADGGEIRYEISLTRDFSGLVSWIGWKIKGIDFAFPSTEASGT